MILPHLPPRTASSASLASSPAAGGTPTASTSGPRPADPVLVDGDPIELPGFLDQVDWQLEELGVASEHRAQVRDALESLAPGKAFGTYEDVVDAGVKALNRHHETGYPDSRQLRPNKPSSKWSQSLTVATGMMAAVMSTMPPGAAASHRSHSKPTPSPQTGSPGLPAPSVGAKMTCTPVVGSTVFAKQPYRKLLNHAKRDNEILKGLIAEIRKKCKGGQVRIEGSDPMMNAICQKKAIDCNGTVQAIVNCKTEAEYGTVTFVHEFQHYLDDCRWGLSNVNAHPSRTRLARELRAVTSQAGAETLEQNRNRTSVHSQRVQSRYIDGFSALHLDGPWNATNPLYKYLVGYARSKLTDQDRRNNLTPESLVDDLEDYVLAQKDRFMAMRFMGRYVPAFGLSATGD